MPARIWDCRLQPGGDGAWRNGSLTEEHQCDPVHCASANEHAGARHTGASATLHQRLRGSTRADPGRPVRSGLLARERRHDAGTGLAQRRDRAGQRAAGGLGPGLRPAERHGDVPSGSKQQRGPIHVSRPLSRRHCGRIGDRLARASWLVTGRSDDTGAASQCDKTRVGSSPSRTPVVQRLKAPTQQRHRRRNSRRK